MTLAPPDTHLEFEYLPKNGRKSILYEHGGFRVSPSSGGRVEFLAHFFYIPENDPQLRNTPLPESFKRWIPVTDLRFFGVGTKFLSGRQLSRKHFCKTIKTPSLKTSCIHNLVVDGPDLRVLESHKVEQNGEIRNLGGAPFIGTHSNQNELLVSPIECVRFFFSGFSRLSNHMLTSGNIDAAKHELVDPSMTGYVDVDTYQIAPNPIIADAATSLQLALVVTSPDLVNVWEGFIQLVSRMQLDSRELAPEFEFPQNSKFLDLSYIPARLHAAGTAGRIVHRVRQIFNDRRDIPFKNLIVVNPSFNFIPINDEDGTRETREYDLKRINRLNLKNSRSNSTSNPISFSGLPGLVDAFPKLKEVKIKIDRTKKVYVPKYIAVPSGRVVDIKDVSSANPDSTNIIQNIIFRPPVNTTKRFGGVEFSPGEQKELFGRPVIEPLQHIKDIPQKVGKHIKLIISAFEELKLMCAAKDDASNSFNNISISLAVYGLPTIWGQWSLDSRDNSERIICEVSIESKGGAVSFIEIDRQGKSEKYAIGVVAHATGRKLSVNDISNIMLHCDHRIKLRGSERKPSEAYSGIWPSEKDYIDVIGSRLVHRARRMHPHFLALDMLSFAEVTRKKM